MVRGHLTHPSSCHSEHRFRDAELKQLDWSLLCINAALWLMGSDEPDILQNQLDPMTAAALPSFLLILLILNVYAPFKNVSLTELLSSPNALTYKSSMSSQYICRKAFSRLWRNGLKELHSFPPEPDTVFLLVLYFLLSPSFHAL